MAEEEGRGEGFLSRWSRLKQARREAPEAEARPAPGPVAAPVPVPAAPPAEPPPAPEAESEPEIDLASLPRIEDLTAESDLTLFLRKGVPEMLKNAALRRVWSLDPTIRDFIGPADYAWDWNVPGGAPGYAETIAHGPDVEALADRILGIGREPAAAPEGPAREALREALAEAPPAPALQDAPQEERQGEPQPVRRSDQAETRPAGPPDPEPRAALTPPEVTPPAVRPPLAAAEAAPQRPRHGGAVPV